MMTVAIAINSDPIISFDIENVGHIMGTKEVAYRVSSIERSVLVRHRRNDGAVRLAAIALEAMAKGRG